MSNKQDVEKKYQEKLVKVNRVTKVNKGGKKLAFRAFVIVGDQKGSIGLATAKSKEVPNAIKRSVELAKKHLYTINIENGTIPHHVVGEFKASKVITRPAPEGTGVIAGGAVRVLLELLGLENVVAKSIGSNNPLNMAKAALEGLKQLKDVKKEEARRGIKIARKIKQDNQDIQNIQVDKERVKDKKEEEVLKDDKN